MRVLLCVLLVACGGSSGPTPTSSGPAAAPIATPASADDVVVAQVNGRPVYGSCVAAQAVAKTKQQALDECIAFELLAQAAEARGLATDPEVTEATRTALVDRLVETGFERKYATPADLADQLAAHVQRNQDRLTRPEGRASAYVRVPLPPKAPPADDFAARTLAMQIAAKAAPEVGLLPATLEAIGKQVAGDKKIEFAEVKMMAHDALVPTYADALFAIAEIGRTAPEAVRTKWGWDVILLTDVGAAKTYTREEAASEAFPEVRRGYFRVWVNDIIRSLGVKIEVDQQQVAHLDEVGP